jgi:hypothetical protein
VRRDGVQQQQDREELDRPHGRPHYATALAS